MQTRIFAVAFLALASPCRAGDSLDSLRQTLQKFQVVTPITVSLERRVIREQKDKPKEDGTVTAVVSTTPDGLNLSLPTSEINQAAGEKLNSDADVPHSVAGAITSLDATDIAVSLNAGDALLHDLDGATLRNEGPDTFHNTPARLLELNLVVHLSKADAARVKEANSTMKMWIGEDGTPLAAETRRSLHGRIMLIGFDITETDSKIFAVHGNRLMTVSEDKINDSSGFGAKAHLEQITAIRPKN